MEISKLLRHMAWANQQIIGKVSQLPDEALDAYQVNPDWTVREIIRHTAGASTWYVYRLLDRATLSEDDKAQWKQRLSDTDIAPARTADIAKVLEKLAISDAELLKASELPEGVVVRELDGKTITRARSTVISQSIHHATEHRAQLVAALESRGFNAINLDDFDLWNFGDTINE